MNSRRNFLKISAFAPVVSTLSFKSFASDDYLVRGENKRYLRIKNTHTKDVYEGLFFKNGRYLHSEVRELERVLRDHRTGEVRSIDPTLYNMLVRLQQEVGCSQFDIISGYRSLKSNRALNKRSSEVAYNSYHTKGQALDIRANRGTLSSLKNRAKGLNVGGVGFYPSSNFIHIDTGPIRSWSGT